MYIEMLMYIYIYTYVYTYVQTYKHIVFRYTATNSIDVNALAVLVSFHQALQLVAAKHRCEDEFVESAVMRACTQERHFFFLKKYVFCCLREATPTNSGHFRLRVF